MPLVTAVFYTQSFSFIAVLETQYFSVRLLSEHFGNLYLTVFRGPDLTSFFAYSQLQIFFLVGLVYLKS